MVVFSPIHFRGDVFTDQIGDALIEGRPAEYLPVVRGYDSNEIIKKKAPAAGMQVIILPRRNRKDLRD